MTLPLSRAFAESPSPLVLEARPGHARIAPEDYPETAIWGYDGVVPGPVIRVPRGGRVTRTFRNLLPQPSTVHWHGIRIENSMDGVPDLTQAAVLPKEEFPYDFIAPDAGTYWYHPHNRTWEQMARGLYGALIVEEPDGAPEVDAEEVLLIDDWRLTQEAGIEESFGQMFDWAHAGRIGNWITVNGQGNWRRTFPRNARLRLRIVNTANARIFSLAVSGLAGWIIALDGQPLDAPQAFSRLDLAPSQRVDLIVDLVAEDGEEAFLISNERDGGYALASFQVDGSLRDTPMARPGPLPANDVAPLGPLDDARQVDLLMEGGAMGGMRGAMVGGRMMGPRDLAARGRVWSFNGMGEFPSDPLIEASVGQTVRIRMQNETAWPHAMHLHGHHFRKVLAGGATGPLRDTLLMDRQETAEIAFVADNPGDWLLHCHMLEHSAGGMMTWLRVS